MAMRVVVKLKELDREGDTRFNAPIDGTYGVRLDPTAPKTNMRIQTNHLSLPFLYNHNYINLNACIEG